MKESWKSELALAGMVTAFILITENPHPFIDYSACPKGKEEVAARLGGHPEDWRAPRGSELWVHDGEAIVITGQKNGRTMVSEGSGILRDLEPGQRKETNNAAYLCKETYRQSLKAIQ